MHRKTPASCTRSSLKIAKLVPGHVSKAHLSTVRRAAFRFWVSWPRARARARVSTTLADRVMRQQPKTLLFWAACLSSVASSCLPRSCRRTARMRCCSRSNRAVWSGRSFQHSQARWTLTTHIVGSERKFVQSSCSCYRVYSLANWSVASATTHTADDQGRRPPVAFLCVYSYAALKRRLSWQLKRMTSLCRDQRIVDWRPELKYRPPPRVCCPGSVDVH